MYLSIFIIITKGLIVSGAIRKRFSNVCGPEESPYICARRNRQVQTCLLANKTGCDKSKVRDALLNYDNHI